MKNIFTFIIVAFTTSAFANAQFHYRFDDVDSFFSNGVVISVEDLRDGFASIPGVLVDEETITVPVKSSVDIILRDQGLIKSYKNINMSAKSGGEMGGG